MVAISSVLDENTADTANAKRTLETGDKESKRVKVEATEVPNGEPSISLAAEVVYETYESTNDNCVHECVKPANYTSPPVPNGEPAKVYPYTLDAFQATAIECLEKRESVLVAAHTSAGKTTVAEYAIAMAMRDCQRIIYTSPIKALSNQKYRDMSDEFKDVGLMTGDVTINPNATIIIMTTEILRSMLYRGSELVRECAWVVFDEVHYMKDRERGVVWEETIILLPDTVRLVFLSATIPNSKEFAEWICRIKHQPCHVVYTDYRPTPLEHFLFPAGGDSVYLVLDQKGQFREDNFHKAASFLQSSVDSTAMETKKSKRTNKNQGQDLEKLLKMCVENNFAPIIVFSFSRKECETNAVTLKKLDFTTDDEKKLIGEVFGNAILTLSEDDRELPQVTSMLNFLSRGIGIHHGGLLPVLKEVVEILFQENLVKILFATETFSMGINMPAKTVVFTNLRKWDGVEFRLLAPGEYIQMSGRAGRRGKDTRGVTIIMMDEKMEPEACKEMFLGSATRIDSAFHLGYNMLLNLLRMEGGDPDYLMQRSFRQFQRDRSTLAVKEEKEAAENLLSERGDISKVVVDTGTYDYDPVDQTSKYYFAQRQVEHNRITLKNLFRSPQYIVPFFNAGRMVYLVDGEVVWGWSVLINTTAKKNKENKENSENEEHKIWLLDVFVETEPGTFPHDPKPPTGDAREGQILNVPLCFVDNISTVRVNLPKELKSAEARRLFVVQLNAIRKHDNFVDGLPELDLVKQMKLPKNTVNKLQRSIQELESEITDNPINTHLMKDEYLAAFQEKMNLTKKLEDLEKLVVDHQSVVMADDLRAMRRVLRKLEFVDKEGIVQVKGRMACDLSSSDELLVAEIVFQNVFDGLAGDHIVALLSCLVFDERSNVEANLDPVLQAAFERIQEVARNVGKVMKESKLPVDVDEYVQKLKPQMIDVVMSWLSGNKFVEIMGSCDLYEGSIVRVMRRLEELVSELAKAAKNIGNSELEGKLTESRHKLKRGIIFAASLYL
eukprot:GEMP01008494.1.p1 GENE.GEMP01008494.1~~GEMP01008494.1.p1  ORF type:complete len:1009 (+),score=176.13 GEMP01008494.1:21-3047(+)